jgi:hypothetical protein
MVGLSVPPVSIASTIAKTIVSEVFGELAGSGLGSISNTMVLLVFDTGCIGSTVARVFSDKSLLGSTNGF